MVYLINSLVFLSAALFVAGIALFFSERKRRKAESDYARCNVELHATEDLLTDAAQ